MSKTKRKLAAIVFTDIQGFTSLSSQNEPAALKLLDKQRQLIKPIVKRYSGEWLKELGDGLLLSFPTSIDAVNCAIFIQETVKDIDNLNLRIGIHQGEVVYSENDILGDDVNIASRLEKFSPVGGIAISNRVNASLERNPKYKTSYIGSPILKGVSQSIKIFCIVSNNLPKSDLSNGLNKPGPSFLKNYLFPITGAILIILGGLFWLILPLLTLGFADGDKNYDKRIAVMYFDNRGDGEDAFFSDGLSEEIMSRLSKLKEISVVSRFDIAQYKNKTNELIDIKHKLKADYVLHGNMQKFGEDLKIFTELINLEDKSIKWSKSFERKITDLFEIQNEIATEIVNNLDINLTSEGQQMVLKASNPNIEAYRKFNAIKYNFMPDDSTSIKSNLFELDNIIKKETTYADAYALKGGLLWNLYMHRVGNEFDDFDVKISEYNMGGFSKSKIYQEILINIEKALMFDSSNLLAMNLSLNSSLHEWFMEPFAPLTTRRLLVKINDFREKYPDHYHVDIVNGWYELVKYHIGLSNNDNKSINYFKSAIEKSKDFYKDDISIRYSFGYLCNFLVGMLKSKPDGLISEVIYYQNLVFDYKLSLGSKWSVQLLKNYNWFHLIENSVDIGDYSTVIDRLIRLKDKTNHLFITNDNAELKIVDSQIDLVLAFCFLQLNDLETSSDILQKIDISRLSNIAQKIDDFSFIDKYTFPEWLPYYHSTISKNYLQNKDYSNALNHRNWILDSKTFKYHKMISHSFLAHHFAKQNDSLVATKHIKKSLTIYNGNSFSLRFNDKIDFFYDLIMAHKILGDDEGFKKYLEFILADITRMSLRLNSNHKKMFLNRYPINKIMELKLNKNHL